MYENRQDAKIAFTKFMVAAISGTVATALLYPLTSTHLRYYLTGHYRNPIAQAVARYRAYGLTGLHHGGSVCVIRDGLSTAFRLGIYTSFTDSILDNNFPLTVGNVASTAVVAGVTSSLIGMPTDLILPRFDVDDYNRWERGKLKREIRQIWKSHGISGLYRSLLSTGVNAGVVSILQFAMYTELMLAAKRYLPNENPVTVSLICGKIVTRIVSIFLAQPFHLLKYRFQLLTMESRKIGLYRFFRIILHHTGYVAMWTGLSIYAASQIPFAISFLTLAKLLSRLYETWKFSLPRESESKYRFRLPWSGADTKQTTTTSPSGGIILTKKFKEYFSGSDDH